MHARGGPQLHAACVAAITTLLSRGAWEGLGRGGGVCGKQGGGEQDWVRDGGGGGGGLRVLERKWKSSGAQGKIEQGRVKEKHKSGNSKVGGVAGRGERGEVS